MSYITQKKDHLKIDFMAKKYDLFEKRKKRIF